MQHRHCWCIWQRGSCCWCCRCCVACAELDQHGRWCDEHPEPCHRSCAAAACWQLPWPVASWSSARQPQRLGGSRAVCAASTQQAAAAKPWDACHDSATCVCWGARVRRQQRGRRASRQRQCKAQHAAAARKLPTKRRQPVAR
jgi:hypothetical protein